MTEKKVDGKVVAILGQVYSNKEKTETKEGWSYPSPDEDMVTGYPDELRDFIGAISHGRAPKSDLMLAHDVLLVTYAAYLSAEKGARVDIRPYLRQ